MKAFYCDRFELPLPDHHRFPMSKYRLLRERAQRELGGRVEFIEPPAATDDQIARVHSEEYLARVREGRLTEVEVRRIGFPWSPELVERSRRSAGATLHGLRAAREEGGVAVNLAGGTHHAFADRGEGFCVFNDSAIAAADALERGTRGVLIVDCDVHQGNGTAAIFHGNPAVFTFSIHGASNYPFEKMKSDLDIAVDNGADDDRYLRLLDDGLNQALDRSDADAAIYVSGADPLEQDRFGKLSLTLGGLEQRDRMVIGRIRSRGLPVVVSMAGGYSPDVELIVAAHLNTVRVAAEHSGNLAVSGRKG